MSLAAENKAKKYGNMVVHVLACGHPRTTVRVAYGCAIFFLLVNDTNEIPEISVVLNNFGRVSFGFSS